MNRVQNVFPASRLNDGLVKSDIEKSTKTYVTYAGAEAQAQKVQELAEALGERYRYIIAATESGRFYPAFIGRDSIDLVHSGFAVAN